MIKDLLPIDNNVQIIAKVIEKKSDTEYKLSDGTGQILAIFDRSNLNIKKIGLNMTLKIFGSLINNSTEMINVKLVSDYSDINLDAYKIACELSKKYFNQS